MQKHIAIIGSTGSVGRQALAVIAADPRSYRVAVLACRSNIKLLEEQIRKFKPSMAAVFNKAAAKKLIVRLGGKVKVLSGPRGLLEIARHKPVDRIVFAADGTESLPALHAAIRARKGIALANKELLVTDGARIMREARKNKAGIIPVDSEHSAIFQCLRGEDPATIEKVILTCSGGPFHGKPDINLKKVTPEQALAHPVWKMGKNISLDSATLMNKAFEMIEAAHLFNLKPGQIEVLIHPEGVVHSLVQFKDGSVKAQLSPPDMRYSIAYALAWPKRKKTRFNPSGILLEGGLTFYRPDPAVFKGLSLAYRVLKRGRGQQALLWKANRIAASRFLSGKIRFTDIYSEIEAAIK